MNRLDILILIILCFSSCTRGKERENPTLNELRKVEENNLLEEVKNCKTQVEKKLCKMNWYTEKNRDSLFQMDSILIFSTRKTENYFLDFECNKDILLNNGSKVKDAWWNIKDDTLEIFMEDNFYGFGDYKIIKQGSHSYTESKNHNLYKIIKIDSLLVLRKVEEIINSSTGWIILE